MSEKNLENDKKKLTVDTNEKYTQVFSHEILVCRMRQLKSHNPLRKSADNKLQYLNQNQKPNNFIKLNCRNIITQSQSDMMDSTEKKIFDFLEKVVLDYPNLSCEGLEKYKPIETHLSKKDLTGKIKVYTKKQIRFEKVEPEFIEMKHVSTQTKSIRGYAKPLNSRLFDKLYIEEDTNITNTKNSKKNN